MNRPGLFITFESIDGVGKSTQIQKLYDYLAQTGHEILLTKEPGDDRSGSCVGPGIRQMLFKHPTTKAMRPGVADLLFLADHVQTAGDVEEAVDRGVIVLCDRYADSQAAYAASPLKQAPAWSLQLYREQYGIVPDITVLLVARGPAQTFSMNISVLDGEATLSYESEDIGWALERAQNRKGVEEGKQDGKAWNSIQAQQDIQKAYIDQLGGQPRTLRVDVWEDDSIEDVSRRIIAGVLDRVSTRLPNIVTNSLLG